MKDILPWSLSRRDVLKLAATSLGILPLAKDKLWNIGEHAPRSDQKVFIPAIDNPGLILVQYDEEGKNAFAAVLYSPVSVTDKGTIFQENFLIGSKDENGNAIEGVPIAEVSSQIIRRRGRRAFRQDTWVSGYNALTEKYTPTILLPKELDPEQQPRVLRILINKDPGSNAILPGSLVSFTEVRTDNKGNQIFGKTIIGDSLTYVRPYAGPSTMDAAPISFGGSKAVFIYGKPETPIVEHQNLESLDLGDTRYNQEIIKQKYPWKLEGDQLFVDWKKDGNYELAFEKVGDKWEIRKFVLKREDVDISSMTCRKIYDLYSKVDTNCIQEDSKFPSSFFIKFKPGDLVWEARKDKDGNILPGSIIYTYAHTRRMPGSPEEVIKIVLQVDYGDGMNQTSFKARDQAVSMFEMNELFPTTREVTFSFRKKWLGDNSREYYEELNNYVENYNKYYLGTYFSPDLLFFRDGYSTYPLY